MADRPDSYLLYSETGAGKTAQLGELAEWEFQRTGKFTELISADSGWDPVEDQVAKPSRPLGMEFEVAGRKRHVCIKAVNIQYLQNPFPVLVKLSEGFWPKLNDKLEPVMSGPGKYLMSPPSLGNIGQVAIEGLATIANMLMQDHIRNLRKIAEDIVGDFQGAVEIEKDGRVSTELQKFGKSGRAHYGHVQDFLLLDLVPRFATLPVARVIWTSHEAKGDDDISGLKASVLGPATIGKAAVPRTAQKFGDTLHLVKLVNGKVNPATRATEYEIEYRAYYQDHPDDVLTKMLWPAKLSFPLARVAELRKRFPGGFIPLTLDKSLAEFFEFKYGGVGKVQAEKA